MMTSVNKGEDSAAMAWAAEACHTRTVPDAIAIDVSAEEPGSAGSESSAPPPPAIVAVLQGTVAG